ncbi:hypothetical protein BJY00DRAFT_200115 [Aspergillus carlsbadensis]|nr:hypothetical protein BJY00DRAFT_200115 [Aspergillus carlsbadensis]
MEPPQEQQSSSSNSARSSISSGTSRELPLGNPAPRAASAPARRGTAQGGGGFLFVDSQADTSQNHVLKKEKQAFALNKYFRRRREAAIERVKPSKPLPSSSRRRPEEQQQATGEGERSKGRDLERNSLNDFNALVQYEAAASQTQSLTTYLSQGHTDPFASFPLEMTNPRYSYFYHFRTHTIPACYPLDATRISTYWWRQAITQPALLQALLFLAAGHQASLQLTNAHGRDSQGMALRALNDSLRSRGDSLKLLQDIIKDPGWAVAESTGLAIATLVTIEAVNANFAAVEAHAKGLRRVFDLFGGLERADHMFLSKIYLSDVKAAALTNTRPSYPIFPKWRNAILQHTKLYQFETASGQQSELKLMTPRELSTLGSAIFSAPWYPGLDPTMKTFLRVFLRLLVYYESAVLTPDLVMDTDNDLYILFEHQLLDTRYTTANPAITTAEDEAEMSTSLSINVNANNSPFNEPLRLTLLTFLTTRMWHLQPFPAMEYTTLYLKEALWSALPDAELDRIRGLETVPDPGTSLCTGTESDPHTVLHHLRTSAPDLLFWILFVGGMASQSYTSYPWFVEQLALSVRSLGLWGWEQGRKVLGGFFWCDQAGLRTAEEVLWRDVLAKAAAIDWEGDMNDREV